MASREPARARLRVWSALFSGTILWYLIQHQPYPLSLWERELAALSGCVIVRETDALLDCGVGIPPAVFVDEFSE
jgi:hypothetical protein